MSRVVLIVVLFLSFIFANSTQKVKLYSKKGEKIANIFCNLDKLPKGKGDLNSTISAIKETQACKNLDDKKLEYVAYYLLNQKHLTHSHKIDVPNSAKCPVCGMFVYKYPKWVAMIEVDGKKHYFDGVKDMLKYYFFDGDFPYDRSKITKMEVTNYYTLEAINAKDAFFVYDSKQYGPMGRELIPFSTLDEAKNFIKDHGGELMRFKEITPKAVMALDGVELK